MKIGDLVRMRDMGAWSGKLGIISKTPRTPHGMWAILLSSGELIGTARVESMEVISENR